MWSGISGYLQRVGQVAPVTGAGYVGAEAGEKDLLGIRWWMLSELRERPWRFPRPVRAVVNEHSESPQSTPRVVQNPACGCPRS
jgi:hypothetical protein